MNRGRRKNNLVAEINITPFTDVILVLLVIFMITTPLIYQSVIKVKLPEAKSSKPTDNAKEGQAYITITNEGVVYLNNDIVTRKELRSQISVMNRDVPRLSVILRSDRLVHFKEVVSVLDILTELGVRNVNIAATAED